METQATQEAELPTKGFDIADFRQLMRMVQLESQQGTLALDGTGISAFLIGSVERHSGLTPEPGETLAAFYARFCGIHVALLHAIMDASEKEKDGWSLIMSVEETVRKNPVAYNVIPGREEGVSNWLMYFVLKGAP